MKIKNKLLLGASILALSVGGLSTISYAQKGQWGFDGGGGSGSSGDCTGTQPRAVNCLDHEGNPVADIFCLSDPSLGPKPATSQPCTYTCGGGGGGGYGEGGEGGYGVDVNGDGVGDFASHDEANAAGYKGVDVNNCGGCGATGGKGKGGTGKGGVDKGGKGKGGTGKGGVDKGGKGGDGGGKGGEGGGGGSSKVLCTYFHRKGEMCDENYYTGFNYGMQHAHPATLRGYHFWAVPYAKYLYNNPNSVLEKIIRPIVLHRADEISYQMGVRDKPNYKGKVIRAIMEPISFTIGLFVGETDYKTLYTKQEFLMLSRKYKVYKKREELKEQGFIAGTPLAAFTI